MEDAPCLLEPVEKERMHVLPRDSKGLNGNRDIDMLVGVGVVPVALS
jgi:hypothetical protein